MDEEAAICGPGSITEQQGGYLVTRVRGPAILEVGCGYGRLLRELARRRPEWSFAGVDFSPSQLRAARYYLGINHAIRLFEVSASALTSLPCRFDTAYTAGCCMHILPERIVQVQWELTRVARRIVHVEETQAADDYIYAHDYAGGYAALGWREVLTEPAPYQLSGQALRVEVFEP